MTHHSLRTDIQPGQRHGTLVVVRHVPRAEALIGGHRSGYWLLRCDCGKECRRQANQIGMSNRQSCGCLRARTAQNKQTILDINRPWRADEHVDQDWLVLIGERSPVGAGTTATPAAAPAA